MNPSLNLTSLQDAWGVSDLSLPTAPEGADDAIVSTSDNHTYASILQFLKKHNLVLTTSPPVSDQSPFPTEFWWNWKTTNTPPPDIVFFLIFTLLFLDKLASILKL